MDSLDRISAILNKSLAFVAGLALIAMMLITVGEMVFRMFGSPMAGTVEIIGWLAAATTAFALGYTQVYQGHVAIDLFFNRLRPRIRGVINMLVYLAATALFMIITWNVFAHAGVLRQSGSLSETMKVIVYPWVYLVSLGCAGLTLALLVDFIKSCAEFFGGKPVSR
ncbi:TRAP transporter small permease [archaeon]|nr:TRAP transporter small permease [archaeon]